jgi:predicted RNA binding protein YcfA (HicA-like mRNA interferase family)
LPQVTGRDLVRALQRAGFAATRQRGSHVQLRRAAPDGAVTTFPVPVHTGRAVKKDSLVETPAGRIAGPGSPDERRIRRLESPRRGLYERIKKGTLHGILRKAGLSPDDLARLL